MVERDGPRHPAQPDLHRPGLCAAHAVRAPTHRRSATHPIGHPARHGGAAAGRALDPGGQVPAVVSQEQFDEVQAKLATNRAFARRNNTAHQYLLRALVSCGCCGLACTGRDATGGTPTTSAAARAEHLLASCDPLPGAPRPGGQLDELVWQDLCALLSEPEPLAKAVARAHGGAWLPQELQARRETLRRGRAHLQQHTRAAYRCLPQGGDPARRIRAATPRPGAAGEGTGRAGGAAPR